MGKNYGNIIYRKETGAYVIGKFCVPIPRYQCTRRNP